MKRRLFKLVLFLLLGAIVNVAVAWVLATSHSSIPRASDLMNDVITAKDFDKVRLQLNASDYPNDSSYLSIVLEYQGYDWSITNMEIQSYISGKTWTKSWEEMYGPHVIIARIMRKGIEQRVVIYGTFKPPKTTGLSSMAWRDLAQRIVGWPFKSLYYYPSYQVSSGVGINAIFIMTREEKVWRSPNLFGKLIPSRDELILPYGMWWPGFVINTVFYALLLWVLALAPFTARRMIRIKRGRCIKCGYDLRETPDKCPECGWVREAEA